MKIMEDGAFERMEGYTDLMSDIGTTDYCVSLREFQRWDGSIEIFVLYDTYLKNVDPVTWTYRNIYDSLSNGVPVDYVQYGDRSFFGNGYDANRFCCPIYRHFESRAIISTADATSTATAISLASDLNVDYAAHLASILQHNAEDTADAITAPTVS